MSDDTNEIEEIDVRIFVTNHLKKYIPSDVYAEIKKGMPIGLNLQSLEQIIYETIHSISLVINKNEVLNTHDDQRKLNTKRESDKNLN